MPGTALWEKSFTALAKYVQEHGHANPPRGLAVEGIDIETWVRCQRRHWDELTDERRRRLRDLPGWTLNAVEEKWNTGYRHLVAYVEKVGSAEVLQSYDADDGYALGKWVSVQRRTWDKMTAGRRNKLAELPGWTLDARGAGGRSGSPASRRTWRSMETHEYQAPMSRRMVPNSAGG